MRYLVNFIILIAIINTTYGKRTEASWYGEETQGYMANGIWYDPNALTCASWDYTLGTLLLVRAVQSSRSVVVEVTDRGPAKRLHARGRTIDLSRAAFERIGELSRGLLEIEIVDAIEPAKPITYYK